MQQAFGIKVDVEQNEEGFDSDNSPPVRKYSYYNKESPEKIESKGPKRIPSDNRRFSSLYLDRQRSQSFIKKKTFKSSNSKLFQDSGNSIKSESGSSLENSSPDSSLFTNMQLNKLKSLTFNKMYIAGKKLYKQEYDKKIIIEKSKI